MGKSLKVNFILAAVLLMCLCLFAISFLTLFTMSSIIQDSFGSIGKAQFRAHAIIFLLNETN